MMYLGNKAVGITYPVLLNWDKVAQGTEDLSVFDDATLSDDVTTIAPNAFAGLPVKNITGYAVTTIMSKSFYNCRSLINISFPNVETIGDEAFRYCASKYTASHFLRLKTIGDSAFRDSAIDYIIAPEVIQIGIDAFYSNTNLKCTDLGNRNITDGFKGVRYCFEQYAGCTVILRYGYVLPADSNWFYISAWLKNPSIPGTLYVWQDLIKDYKNHAVWGPLLASNGNRILPIEGSMYEEHYGDGTPIE